LKNQRILKQESPRTIHRLKKVFLKKDDIPKISTQPFEELSRITFWGIEQQNSIASFLLKKKSIPISPSLLDILLLQALHEFKKLTGMIHSVQKGISRKYGGHFVSFS
jgi:hypothetical protein